MIGTLDALGCDLQAAWIREPPQIAAASCQQRHRLAAVKAAAAAERDDSIGTHGRGRPRFRPSPARRSDSDPPLPTAGASMSPLRAPGCARGIAVAASPRSVTISGRRTPCWERIDRQFDDASGAEAGLGRKQPIAPQLADVASKSQNIMSSPAALTSISFSLSSSPIPLGGNMDAQVRDYRDVVENVEIAWIPMQGRQAPCGTSAAAA